MPNYSILSSQQCEYVVKIKGLLPQLPHLIWPGLVRQVFPRNSIRAAPKVTHLTPTRSRSNWGISFTFGCWVKERNRPQSRCPHARRPTPGGFHICPIVGTNWSWSAERNLTDPLTDHTVIIVGYVGTCPSPGQG